jgi:ribosomal protein L21E
VLPRRTTAKIITTNQNLAAICRGLIQRKAGDIFAILIEAQVVKQKPAKTFTGCRGQESSRDDLIGIDILGWQNHGS